MILTIDKSTWTALRLLQDSIDFMSRDPRYYKALVKERKLYKYMIREIYENSYRY